MLLCTPFRVIDSLWGSILQWPSMTNFICKKTRFKNLINCSLIWWFNKIKLSCPLCSVKKQLNVLSSISSIITIFFLMRTSIYYKCKYEKHGVFFSRIAQSRPSQLYQEQKLTSSSWNQAMPWIMPKSVYWIIIFSWFYEGVYMLTLPSYYSSKFEKSMICNWL